MDKRQVIAMARVNMATVLSLALGDDAVLYEGTDAMTERERQWFVNECERFVAKLSEQAERLDPQAFEAR